jgi:hypothetical protein
MSNGWEKSSSAWIDAMGERGTLGASTSLIQ